MQRKRTTTMLWRMLWTDTRALMRETIVLMVLIGLGVMLYVGLYEAHQYLSGTYEHIYRTTRLADASVLMESAPASLVDKARGIPHVRAAMGRVVKDGTIIQRDRRRERVTGRFVGCPLGRRPSINDLQIIKGRYLKNGDEAILEHQFAGESGYKLGDRIKCSYQGREREFTLVGMAISPEYVYPVPSKFSPFVARGTFGVVFIAEDRARAWLGLGARITEVHCLTEPGWDHDVLKKLEGLCRPYGIETSYVQDDQPSKRLLDMDQQGFAVLSVFFPILFLMAAGLSLYGALNRMVRLRITVIGTLKASGFGSCEILRHYVLQGLLVGVGGGVPGAVLGHWMALGLGTLYVKALHLPLIARGARWDTLLTGTTFAVVTGVAAAFLPAQVAARLRPAVAMRGEIGDGRKAGAERRIIQRTRWVPVMFRIPLRGIFRRASRTLLALGGIAGGAIIMITTFGTSVSTLDAIDEYVTRTRRYQIDLQFSSPRGIALAEAAAGHPGARATTPTVSVPVRIRTPWGSGELILTGIQRGQQLLKVASTSGKPIEVEVGKIWIPKQFAERLQIEPGDPIMVEWAKSSRRRRLQRVMCVAGFVDAAIGGAAYAEYRDVRRSLADKVFPESFYGAFFDCDPSQVGAFQRRFEHSDDVALVSTTEDVKRQIDEQMAVMFVFIGVLLAFGSVLAGSAIHSVATVSLLERTRELGTLRTLGFSAAVTAGLAALELCALAAAGLLVGIPLGVHLNALYMRSFTTDTMSFRAILPCWTYIATIAIVFAMVGLSAYSGMRRLQVMDLAQATKAQE